MNRFRSTFSYTHLAIIFFAFITSNDCIAQDIFNDSIIHEFKLEFNQSDWESQLKYSFDNNTDIPATIYIDNKKFDSVGVKYKGHSSYLASQEKKPFNITLDAFINGQSLDGFSTFNLNNGFKDPSFIREIISYQIISNFLPAVKAAFTKLYINNVYWGIYVLVQQPNKKFLRDNFGDDNGNYYKADPIGDLVWVGNNPDDYKRFFEKKTNEAEDDWNDIIYLINILNNAPPEFFNDEIEKVLNVDRALWYLAFCNVFCNLDSYTGSGHNYYLYCNPYDNRFNFIPWDLNENLGVFQMGMNITQLENLSWDYNAQNKRRPLLQKLLSVKEYRERYIAHQKAIIKNFLYQDYWQTLIIKYQNLIRNDLINDTKKLYTIEMFLKNVNENTPLSQGTTPFIVPGVLSFINNRRNYFDNNPLFQRMEPTIVSVSNIPENPDYDNEVRIEARIMLAQNAYLFYSINNNPFIKIQMNLTQPGDVTDTWEGIIPPQKPGTSVRYYIESVSDQGVYFYFPEFAEHRSIEYIIPSNSAFSDVVINEVQPANQHIIQDPQGSFPDWIELFNTSSTQIDLSGKYLSDDPDRPLKWKFPDGTQISGGDYLLIWADGDTLDSPGLHTNFKLSKSGESVIFSDSDVNSNALLDSTSFGEISDDYAWGRIPNGTGIFKILSKPTPGYKNEDNATQIENTTYEKYRVYIIRDDSYCKLYFTALNLPEITIFISDILGNLVMSKYFELKSHQNFIILDTRYLPSGAYFVKIITDGISNTLFLPITK